MGFYVQDEYWEVVSDMTASQQNEYIGSLARLYFTGEGSTFRSKQLEKYYLLSSKRVMEARRAADRKAGQREGQTTGQTTGQDAGQITGQAFLESERESKNIRFTPPTREEAAEYLESVGLEADLDKVFDHYESNGWKCGRNPMRDWRAAFRRAAREWAKGGDCVEAGEYADAI